MPREILLVVFGGVLVNSYTRTWKLEMEVVRFGKPDGSMGPGSLVVFWNGHVKPSLVIVLTSW